MGNGEREARRTRRGPGHAVARRPAQGGRRGDDRHRRHRVHRHAGAAVRQADHRSSTSSTRSSTTASRAATTCSRSTWRWSRSRATRWPTGRTATATSGSSPDMATLRRDPVARPHRARALRRRRPRRLAGRRLAAPGPDRPVRARPRDGLHAAVRVRARVLPLQGELRRGPREGLQRTSPRRSPTSSTTTSSRRRWTSSTSARSGAACTPPGSRSSSPRARRGTASTRSTPATPTPSPSADRHTIYKNGVKEIAFLNGISATFMAKPSEKDIGSSCHIHSSLVGEDGKSAFVDGDEETDTFRHYLGGMRAHIRELALFVAPSINSYKRYATESWAPTSISWGRDNRTCGFRIVGHGQSRRVECRIPGADVNPYLGYRGAARRRPRRDRERDRPGPGAEGQRLRGRRGRAVPVDAARGGRPVGGERVRQAGLRRGGPQALPQLRALRAEAVRPGRHRLRAPAHVRARLGHVVQSAWTIRSSGSSSGCHRTPRANERSPTLDRLDRRRRPPTSRLRRARGRASATP